MLDFTPEWDCTAGGSKLLLTGSVLPGARTEAHTRPLFIKFDQTEVCCALYDGACGDCTTPAHVHIILLAQHHVRRNIVLLGRGQGDALVADQHHIDYVPQLARCYQIPSSASALMATLTHIPKPSGNVCRRCRRWCCSRACCGAACRRTRRASCASA